MKTFLIISVAFISCQLAAQKNNAGHVIVSRIISVDGKESKYQYQDSLVNFIQQHIKYPREDINHKVQGLVIVGFKVMPDGTISDAVIKFPLSTTADAESLRVLKSFPRYKKDIIHQGQAIPYAMHMTYHL
jgi:outer membrane biosynthesis protein TonB